jgi:hypothetical protein
VSDKNIGINDDNSTPQHDNDEANTTESAFIEHDDDMTMEQPKQTTMLDMSNLPDSEPMRPRIPTPNTQLLKSGSRIIFIIGEKRKVFAVSEEGRVLIGRVADDEAKGKDLHFDLTPFGAYHFGVSRQHAVIKLREGYLYLEDLGSTNGTRINGFQLTTHQPYRMRDGDEVEFGKLRTSIRFGMIE